MIGVAERVGTVSQYDGRADVDHRSRLSSSDMIGGGTGGGPEPGAVGGVNQPSRAAAVSPGASGMGFRSTLGGTISATTRSWSVTSTVSPAAASHTYSLGLSLSVFRPTDLMAAT